MIFEAKFESTDETFETEFITIDGAVRGESAYEVAVRNGFEGTEQEWLDSLKGKDGKNGADGYTPRKGIDYFDGAKGDKGDKGDTGAKGDKGDKGDTGSQGIQGEKGADGKDGTNGKDGYTPIKGVDYFTESDKEELVNEVVSELPDTEVDAATMTEITYTDLKSLRDNAGLKAGGYYRITDYVTTTVQEATKSAGHPFDILVMAVSETELETKVSAVLHGGDEYFANNDLSAWELWYSLDNDVTRFAWADEANGKGVIFRMIDENGNDCPYDFKNIQMKNALNTADETFYYTFDTNGEDLSLDSSQCYDNVIRKYVDGSQRINRIIFITRNYKEINNNFFDVECYNNTLDGRCRNLRFERECYGNKFGYGCTTSNFETKFRNNIVGSEVQSINVGKGASNNVFNSCIYYSTFGTYFRNNHVASYTYYSDFGHYVQNMIMGKDTENMQTHFRYLIVEGNNTYFNLVKDDSIAARTYVANITVAQGTSGKSADRLMINIDQASQAYKLTYAKNSSGELKQYCEADKENITDSDKQEMFTELQALQKSETWTFTLEDGSTVEKQVLVK